MYNSKILRLLQEQCCPGMIFLVQHKMKTLIICTGVVWLALPAAIVLNYHLAFIVTWHTSH